MAERSLSDIFKKVAPLVTGRHKEIFEKATDVKVKIDREHRIAEASVSLPELYKKREIYSLENIIKEKYELKSIMILTHYPAELVLKGLHERGFHGSRESRRSHKRLFR